MVLSVKGLGTSKGPHGLVNPTVSNLTLFLSAMAEKFPGKKPVTKSPPSSTISSTISLLKSS